MSFSVAHRAQKIYSTVLEIFDYKKSSDVVTPYDAVKQQVEGVSSNAIVCIPGAGIGTYVVALIEQGIKPENIYTVELDESYYKLGSAMLERLGVNYVHTDFLDWNPSMQFDVIVGNPPYQNPNKGKKTANGRSSNGSPLWVKFIRKSTELLKEGGTLSLLIPSAVTTPNSRGMSAAKGMTLVDVKFNMNSYFGVGTDISRVTWVKSKVDAPLTVNGVDYPRHLPIANVADESEFNRLVNIWSGSSKWEYMDNRGHDKRQHKDDILVIRRMYSGSTFKYNEGLDMSKFDKESLVGLRCSSPEEMSLWVNFLNSDASKFIRRVTNYAGNISAAFLQPIDPTVLN